MRRSVATLLAASPLFALPLFVVAGCGDGTTMTMSNPDMAISLPPLFVANDKTMATKANMACNTRFADPLMATAQEETISGVIKDFQDDNLVAGATVSLYQTPDQVTKNQPIATSVMPSAMDGTYTIKVPKGVGRVIRGVAGGKAISNGLMKDTIPAYEFGIRWDDKAPIAVKVSTREALNGLVSVVQMDGLGVVAGATHDCDDKEMGGANVVVSDGAGKAIGQGPYYFVDAAGSTVPSRNAKYTGEGGVFASFNVPPGTASVNAIGVIGSGTPVAVSKASVPVIADAITIIHLLPLAQ